MGAGTISELSSWESLEASWEVLGPNWDGQRKTKKENNYFLLCHGTVGHYLVRGQCPKTDGALLSLAALWSCHD